MAETIGRQTASYREGLVLGLTMAEIMLLLVFCLLVGVGVAFRKGQVINRAFALLRSAITRAHYTPQDSAAPCERASIDLVSVRCTIGRIGRRRQQ